MSTQSHFGDAIMDNCRTRIPDYLSIASKQRKTTKMNENKNIACAEAMLLPSIAGAQLKAL